MSVKIRLRAVVLNYTLGDLYLLQSENKSLQITVPTAIVGLKDPYTNHDNTAGDQS